MGKPLIYIQISNIINLFNQIKTAFILPKKQYYFGRIKYGTPYFNPRNYLSTIIGIRQLYKYNQTESQELQKNFPHSKQCNRFIYKNLPMVRRNPYKIIKILNTYWYINWGWPISFTICELGWKDKFDTPRLEWEPFIQLNFFDLQFQLMWTAPIKNKDKYWEQILWYIYYANKDIILAEQSWPWKDCNTQKSSWNKKIQL